uniref:50S ribosomal protein L6 n=1 Tax=Cavernulicola chilensis TaxID=3028028 RepID=A0A7H0WB94_9RHOD|nr:50S ribosomal protein L6 [Cavernulicola chilensis]QNR39823.1 50S ribosomal protein L6 [Cavernulicola chilensis]
MRPPTFLQFKHSFKRRAWRLMWIYKFKKLHKWSLPHESSFAIFLYPLDTIDKGICVFYKGSTSHSTTNSTRILIAPIKFPLRGGAYFHVAFPLNQSTPS